MSDNMNHKEKTLLLIVVLIIIVIILQIFHLVKLDKVSVNSEIINMKLHYGSAREYLKNQSYRLKDDFEKTEKHFRRKKSHNMDVNSHSIPLLKSKKYDSKEEVYILEIAVPMGLQKDNIELDLRKNVLSIAFGGYVQVQSADEEVGDVFSVYRVFEIPETKAKLSDVKYDIQNGILTIIVPIIK